MTRDEIGYVARTRDGEIRLHKPTVYQASADGRTRRAIDGRYRVTRGQTIAFDIGNYDRKRPLVIDPVVVYSTYLGGGAGEQLKSGRFPTCEWVDRSLDLVTTFFVSNPVRVPENVEGMLAAPVQVVQVEMVGAEPP